MSSRYDGKIKVVGADLMCFPVSPTTLEASGCSCFDLWAITDPDPTPIETIDVNEWNFRLNKKRDDARNRR